MPTVRQIKDSKINTTSTILKITEDYSPISQELIKELRYKILLENPKLKLSIEDYELMCKNPKVLNMMSIVFKTNKTKLKKFCRYISVFKDNIDNSPKKIAYKINGPIFNLPKELRSVIIEKFSEILPSKYVLLDWIDIKNLDNIELSQNPNAIDLLTDNLDKIDWDYLSYNPNAIDLLKDNQDNINWSELSANPNAISLLKNRITYEQEQKYKRDYSDSSNSDNDSSYSDNDSSNSDNDSFNSDNKINWNALSYNPNAISLLKANKKKINWKFLSRNPNAIDLLADKINYEKSLPASEYKALMDSEKISWSLLSGNPNAIDLLKSNSDNIIWDWFLINPNAIPSLESKQDEIKWNLLSINPNAIDLLTARINYEKSLPASDYKALMDYEKISWSRLSGNPNAIDLLKDKINYEKSLPASDYNALMKYEKISWSRLAGNPNAIDLLKDNLEEIKSHWDNLSKNPGIFKAE